MARSPTQTRPPSRVKRTIRARDLEIDLESGTEGERFQWFLTCLLFGKPIQREVARRAYLEFAREGLVTPQAILDAGWDRLVSILVRRLQGFTDIGPVTTRIFLRDFTSSSMLPFGPGLAKPRKTQ